MAKRTFVECLRFNIEHNWDEGGLFRSMTKDDCLKACDKIKQLQAENKRLREAMEKLNRRIWCSEGVQKIIDDALKQE